MGGGLVCEFAYIRQEETESYEVNSFPFGQTHVGFTNLCFKGYSSDERERLYGEKAYALRASSLKDGITIAYGSDFSPNVPKFSRCITTLRAVARNYSKQ